MDFSLKAIAEALILVIALSADAFVSSLAYGTDKIKIPFISAAIISIICSMFLGLFLFLGVVLNPFIPSNTIKFVCFAILLVLGIVKLFENYTKIKLSKNQNLKKEVKFSVFSLSFILNIYSKPVDADKDKSKVLSPLESVTLSIALSLDGIAAGFGTGMLSNNYVLIIILSLTLSFAAIIAGVFIGKKISQKLDINLSWLSGILLILLAFSKLFL